MDNVASALLIYVGLYLATSRIAERLDKLTDAINRNHK